MPVDLQIVWEEITAKYTDNKTLVESLWTEIKKEYSCSTRHYHNLNHLAYMARMAMKYKNKLSDFDTVMLAIFYHDIVYNNRRQDNEQKSADIAGDRLLMLGVPSHKITKCKNLINATKTHEAIDDNDADFLVDFDLAILGDTSEHYQEYTRQIRREYAIYPEFLYKKGRKKVLQHFLQMQQIFKTKQFRDRYEQTARNNMTSELKSL